MTAYRKLLNKVTTWANQVYYPVKQPMWTYSKDKLSTAWNLQDLYNNVQTGELLGYDVKLYSTSAGLEVKYVKKLPQSPL